MEEYLPQLLLAWSIQLMGVMSPGPGVALILGVATAQGRQPALLTTLGIASGTIVLALATVLGISAVFAQMAGVMTIVRLVGAAYLAWLAYGAFRRAINPPPLTIRPVEGGTIAKLWSSGFLMQISNPKAIFFWLAIAGVGGVGDAPVWVVAVFVLGAFVNSFLGHGLWAVVLSSGPVRSGYLRARRFVEATLGTFFGFAAFTLATSRT
jgi:threonine efflux protein